MKHKHSSQRVSKEFYLMVLAAILAASSLLSAYLLSAVRTRGLKEARSLAPLMLLTLLAVFVLTLSLWYRMWAAIQDGYARITPARAVGLMLIPLFNIYWVFVACWGFSKDYNCYLVRHNLALERLPEGFFLTYVIISLTAWIPFAGIVTGPLAIVLNFMLIAKICDAVNRLPQAQVELV
jgi:hypothetical protein